VDKLFIEFLEELFSKVNIQQIKKERYNEWMKIMQDFEKAKRSIVMDCRNEKVSIGTSELCPWNREHFNDLSNEIWKGVELKGSGRLIIPTSIIKEMIEKIAIKIKDHIAKLLIEIDLSTLSAVLMVGGFSNSSMVFEEMKKLVSDKVPLIVPESMDLCIVKGAVIFGWNSNIIRTRKSRMTYGLGVNELFIDGYHDEHRSYIDRSGKRCRDCFYKFSTINQDIFIDKQVQWSGVHSYKHRDNTSIQLYATEMEDPKYTDEDCVKKVGEIHLPKTKKSYGKKIDVNFSFGTTELKVVVHDVTTDEKYEGHFDFLLENEVKFIK